MAEYQKGVYSGYYSAHGNVPSALQDAVNNQFEIRLLSTHTSNDTLVGGPGVPTLILKPEFRHIGVLSSEEMYKQSSGSVILMACIVVLWIAMMAQVFLFLRDISKGLIFNPITVSRLFWLALILMVISVARFFWDKIYIDTVGVFFERSTYLVVDKAEFNSVVFITGAGMLLFVYILKIGLRIKREADLTI